MRRRVVGRFNLLTMTAPADIDGLSLEALKALVLQLLSKSADQDRLIAELREENARLKGLRTAALRIKPSGMEIASEPKLSGNRGEMIGGAVRSHRGVAIEDRVIKAQAPPGSRFKGYETFVVQDIVPASLQRSVTDASAGSRRMERWCWLPCQPV